MARANTSSSGIGYLVSPGATHVDDHRRSGGAHEVAGNLLLRGAERQQHALLDPVEAEQAKETDNPATNRQNEPDR